MSRAADTGTLVDVLRECDDEPPALELAERLADAADVDVLEAQDRVYDALDSGLLEEHGEGVGAVRLADDSPELNQQSDTTDGEVLVKTDDGTAAATTEPLVERGSDAVGCGGQTPKTGTNDPQESDETTRQRFDTEPDEYITDPDFDGSEEAVRQYYRAVRSVFERFVDLDGVPTTGFAGNSGWYRYEKRRDDSGVKVRHRRAYTFERDFEELLEELIYDDDDNSWRSFYNITTWKDSEAVYAGATAASYDGFDQGDGLAGYGDMRGFPLWVDLDLNDNDGGSDGVNYKRRRGNLDDDQRETVEAAYQAYAEEFAELVGLTASEIPIFDSGGGAYLYTPAAVTLPIAERYDDDTGPFGDARTLIFKELRQRLYAYGTGTAVNKSAENYGFEGIGPRVNDAVDGAAELLAPDWLQNRNRQSKAPLSLHGDHDIAVTPARSVGDPEQIEYVPTPVSDVDEEVIAHTEAEVDKLVSVPEREELEHMTESFVSTLFPEYAEEADGWRETLDCWLAAERDEKREAVHEAARDRRENRQWLSERKDVDTTTNDTTSEIGNSAEVLRQLAVTKHHSDVIDALENPNVVEITDVVRDYCCTPAYSEESNATPADERVPWVSADRGHEITFDPSWRGSNSGESCAISDRTIDRETGEIVTTTPDTETAHNGFVDSGCTGSGGPAVAYALGTGILPTTDDPEENDYQEAAAESLNGRQWLEAVDGLREAGYPIPIYVPEAGAKTKHGDQYDQTPLWALRKAAVALGVCDRGDFVEREGDDGGTYLGFASSTDYNQTLRKLDERGIDTGRDPTTQTRSEYYDASLSDYVDDSERDPYTDPETMLRACLRARAAGAVDVEAEPPTLALIFLQSELLGIEPNRDMSDGTRARLVETYHDITEADVDRLLG